RRARRRRIPGSTRSAIRRSSPQPPRPAKRSLGTTRPTARIIKRLSNHGRRGASDRLGPPGWFLANRTGSDASRHFPLCCLPLVGHRICVLVFAEQGLAEWIAPCIAFIARKGGVSPC